MNILEETARQKIDLGALVELTLFHGVAFTTAASTFPYAFIPESSSTEKGMQVAGYIVGMGGDREKSSYVDLCPSNAKHVGLPGCRVYGPAVHSLRLLRSSE